MDTMKSKAMVGVIIALLVGGGIGYAAGNSMADDTTNESMGNESSMQSTQTKEGVVVGGALMVREKDIVDNAVNAPNVTTVVSLVKLAGLVDTLKSPGPFTVFAPNNDAFAKLPAETVASVQMPENKELLTSILTYHVVAGTYTSADLNALVATGGKLKTVQGAELSVVREGGMLMLVDTTGAKIEVETPDVISSNGVTHVISSVMMPQ